MAEEDFLDWLQEISASNVPSRYASAMSLTDLEALDGEAATGQAPPSATEIAELLKKLAIAMDGSCHQVTGIHDCHSLFTDSFRTIARLYGNAHSVRSVAQSL